MAQNEAAEEKLWGDCERCGEENCVMVCHVDRLRGEEEFKFLGAEALKDVQIFENSIAEGGLDVACTKCGHAYGSTKEED